MLPIRELEREHPYRPYITHVTALFRDGKTSGKFLATDRCRGSPVFPPRLFDHTGLSLDDDWLDLRGKGSSASEQRFIQTRRIFGRSILLCLHCGPRGGRAFGYDTFGFSATLLDFDVELVVRRYRTLDAYGARPP